MNMIEKLLTHPRFCFLVALINSDHQHLLTQALSAEPENRDF